ARGQATSRLRPESRRRRRPVCTPRGPGLARRADVMRVRALACLALGLVPAGQPDDGRGLLLPSGNDAAEQLASVLDESRATFVAAMNARIAELGLRDTHFVNPSGIDAESHYSSAYDLAKPAGEACAAAFVL